jgi:hypothetical protein
LSRPKSAWFSGQDATELVKIRYNFACVVLLICEYYCRSITGTADRHALVASYDVMRVTFRRKNCSR